MWLYFTKEKFQSFVIILKAKQKLRKRVELNRDCKLSTPDLTLQSSQNERYIKAYLPNLIYNSEKDVKIDFPKHTLKQLIKDPKELTKLNSDIKDIKKYLGKSNNHVFNNHVFNNKYIMYPVGAGTLIIINIVCITLYIVNK